MDSNVLPPLVLRFQVDFREGGKGTPRRTILRFSRASLSSLDRYSITQSIKGEFRNRIKGSVVIEGQAEKYVQVEFTPQTHIANNDELYDLLVRDIMMHMLTRIIASRQPSKHR